jgi:hypothetical protein
MNNKKGIALSVVGFKRDSQGITIEGQCLESPIQIGDTFTSIVPNCGKDSNAAQTVNLKVDSIIINGSFEVKELEHGYGGIVHLRGNSTELIENKSFLYGFREKL